MKHIIKEEKSISEIVTQSSNRLYNLIMADLGNRSEEAKIEVFFGRKWTNLCRRQHPIPSE